VDTTPGSVLALQEVRRSLAQWLGAKVSGMRGVGNFVGSVTKCAMGAVQLPVGHRCRRLPSSVQPWRVIAVEGSRWPAVLCYAVTNHTCNG
jgi:hypothetical protein